LQRGFRLIRSAVILALQIEKIREPVPVCVGRLQAELAAARERVVQAITIEVDKVVEPAVAVSVIAACFRDIEQTVLVRIEIELVGDFVAVRVAPALYQIDDAIVVVIAVEWIRHAICIAVLLSAVASAIAIGVSAIIRRVATTAIVAGHAAVVASVAIQVAATQRVDGVSVSCVRYAVVVIIVVPAVAEPVTVVIRPIVSRAISSTAAVVAAISVMIGAALGR